jgi:hypothetical protein
MNANLACKKDDHVLTRLYDPIDIIIPININKGLFNYENTLFG